MIGIINSIDKSMSWFYLGCKHMQNITCELMLTKMLGQPMIMKAFEQRL